MNDSPTLRSLSELPLGSTITRKCTSTCTLTNGSIHLDIPVELVSEEEMAVIEAALAATCSSLSSSAAPAVTSPTEFQRNAESIQSIIFLPKMELVSEEEMDVLEAALAATCSSLSSSAAPAVTSPSEFRRNAESIQSITFLPKMELVSEEEMDVLEAALAATCSSLSSSAAPAVTSPSEFRRNAESIQSITFLPKMELVSEEEMDVLEAALAATCSSLSSSAAPAVTSPSEFLRNAESIQSIPFLSKMELVSEEEMAVLDVAQASACSSLSSSATPAVSSPSQFQGRSRSIRSITSLAKRRLSFGAEPDIDDSGNLWSTRKKRVAESFLHRFKSNSGLSVSDITATEWCQKKKEFELRFGSRKITEAMRIRRARHAKLEEEVTKKVEVQGNSVEDGWAKKLMNFIIGANQLLSKGLTRELPLIGCAEGVWLVGMVDEVRMPVTEADRNPMLVDTKTRVQDTPPAEEQIRNGRLQLMCYKYLWDNLVAHKFPSKKFLDFFSLNPSYILSKEIQQNTAESGFPAMTLDELLRYYEHKCSMLPRAHDQLLVRAKFIGLLSFGWESEKRVALHRKSVGNAGFVNSLMFVLLPQTLIVYQPLHKLVQIVNPARESTYLLLCYFNQLLRCMRHSAWQQADHAMPGLLWSMLPEPYAGGSVVWDVQQPCTIWHRISFGSAPQMAPLGSSRACCELGICCLKGSVVMLIMGLPSIFGATLGFLLSPALCLTSNRVLLWTGESIESKILLMVDYAQRITQ
ncbi:Exonuclease V, chloroplastic [Morella rubra]|uniref:Exonuclease V, chloroplastic n=1 Tax=Morella rubra TaxID=262757 RepID=A0A6A1WQV2_9ROSI|nr:Exonuclease V, chloroplastic [Morella rubra]